MIKYVTQIKAIMLLFVVFGHSCIIYTGWWSAFSPASNSEFFSFITKWLNTFHTYSFVFVSGALYYHLKYKKDVPSYRCNKSIVKKKLKRLIFPYLVTSFVWAIPINCLIDGINFKLYTKFILGVRCDQLWFLLMLFWVFVFTILLTNRINMGSIKKKHTILIMISAYGLYIFSVFLNSIGVQNYFQLISVMCYEMYFILGMLFEREYCRKILNLRKTQLISLEFLLCILSLGGTFVVEEYLHGVGKYLFLPIVTIAGILFWIIFIIEFINSITKNPGVSFIQKTRILRKIWVCIKNNSFYIYLDLV